MIKLKIQSAVLILFALSSISGCSLTKIQQKGFTRSDSFDYKCQFSTVKTLIVLPVAIIERTLELNRSIYEVIRILGSSLLTKDNIKDLLQPVEVGQTQDDGQLQLEFDAR